MTPDRSTGTDSLVAIYQPLSLFFFPVFFGFSFFFAAGFLCRRVVGLARLTGRGCRTDSVWVSVRFESRSYDSCTCQACSSRDFCLAREFFGRANGGVAIVCGSFRCFGWYDRIKILFLDVGLLCVIISKWSLDIDGRMRL